MDRYAVIGHPVAHSRSPDIHAAFALQCGHALAYDRVLAPLDGFAATVESFRARGGLGANVTVPFKEDAFALAVSRTARALKARAVNALKFEAGDIKGDNTDGVGLVRDIVTNLGVPLKGRRLLLVGAGGAARGALGPLLEEGPAEVVIANRTEQRAIDLAEAFEGVQTLAFSQLPGEPFDVVINATAASLGGQALPLGAVYRQGALAYDMMYGRDATPFMRAALDHGTRVADGLGMLVEQAAESFLFWRGVLPKTSPVIAQLRGTRA